MFTHLRDYRIIPTIENIEVDEAVRVAEALMAAELPVLEIMYKNQSDAQSIRAILDIYPDFVIGVGGILNADLVLRSADAKPKFMTSPGFSSTSIEESKKHDVDYASGMCTPTDVMNSITAGVTDMLFFPAEYFGGVAMLEELIRPFSHLNVNVVVKGGVTVNNMHEYLKLPTVAGIVCPWIVDENSVQYKKWDTITENAIKARELCKEKQTVYFS